ncbi:hypothetical protein DDZ13_12715 [Coraliomargarita sinensis]|uniref:Uncharacterized protein n=1 Tax=Coraliomargarita sinensis TaxID=2174842 RepID=A0A317ZER1_9BACT|nr:hypothetical protein [Coraliomargarita sinensis]PXA03282.1 hypothetical protein DDZ13_12715 [Coraliomargarita sinensis]
MPQELIDSVSELVSACIDYEPGSTQFYVVLGAFAVAWIVVARVFMGLLKSDRGFLAATVALILPFFFGLLAYGVVDVRVVPQIEADWAGKYLPLASFVFVALLVILYLSKRVFMVSGYAAVFIFAFATAAAVTAFFGVEVTLKTLEKGEEQLKQRDERDRETIDSVL